MFGCFVPPWSLVQIKTHRVDDRDQTIHQWGCVCQAGAVIIISYWKVRDVTKAKVMVAVFILSRNIFNIWRCGNPVWSNIILTRYDGDLDVWRIQIPISLLGINFQTDSVASPAGDSGDRNMDRSGGRKLLEIFQNNSVKYLAELCNAAGCLVSHLPGPGGPC